MGFIYQFLWYFVILALKLYTKFKAKFNPSYRERQSERFAQIMPEINQSIDVWIHAVSLGESIAISPLVWKLIERKLRVLLTTMTPTGSAYIKQTFGDSITHQYLPYDYLHYVRKFYNHYTPRVAVMMETEIWPNYLIEANRRDIPLFLVNARLSAKSYSYYILIRFFISVILKKISMIATQSPLDAQRYIQLGAPAKQVDVFGNVKFDITKPKDNLINSWLALKQQWGQHRFVLILASTHANEEELFILRLARLKQAIPDLFVIVAPRHPERFNEVEQLASNAGLNIVRKTQAQLINSSVDILLLDTMGELMGAYSCADYAFVGGSLVARGGHNVLEPIAMGVVVFVGPFMHNFQWIHDELLAENAIIQATSVDMIFEQLICMYKDATLKDVQIQQAFNVLARYKGATEKYLNLILSHANLEI